MSRVYFLVSPFLFAFALNLFYLTYSCAEIEAINGSMLSGQEIILSGAEFGTKRPAAPILWEQFERGTNGGLLTDDPKWKAYTAAPNGGYFSDAESYSGRLSAYNRILGYSNPEYKTNNNFNTSNFFFNPTDTVYYSWVWKYKFGDINIDNTFQIKSGRINASPNTYNGAGVMLRSPIWPVTGNPGPVVLCWDNDPSHCTPANDHYHTERLQYNSWIRDEIFKKESTPGISDGYAYGYLGGSASEVFFESLMTRGAGETFQMDNIILGIMGANPAPNADIRIYVDDVYVDNTQARVELCPGTTWESRGQCDIQIPASWSNTSITVTANTGLLTKGEKAYLYVVDKNGVVSNNGNGFEVLIGSPAPPSGLNLRKQN